MLSRLLGRRAPLAPARLFALTAGPGRTLARSVTVIHQELGELALPDGAWWCATRTTPAARSPAGWPRGATGCSCASPISAGEISAPRP